MNEEKKISLVSMLIVFPLVIMSDSFDVLGLVVMPIPAIGQAVWLMTKAFSFATWMIIQAWMYFTGVRGTYYFIGSMLDVVMPFAQTMTLAATVFITNNPKLASLAATAAVGAATGGVGAVAMRAGAVARGAKAAEGVSAASKTAKTSSVVSRIRQEATSYVPYGDESKKKDDRVGSATPNFAQARRRAQEVLTPEEARNPSEKLQEQLFPGSAPDYWQREAA